jgi:hypothetical protein
MSKQCSICSLPDEVLTKVFELYTLGSSQQKIVKTIQEQFSLAVSASALNRHFNHCTSNCTPTGRGNLELSSLREKLSLPVMTGKEIYKVQCRILAEEMECFVRKIAQKEPTDMSLDDLKCLDVLMGMRVKLYPSTQEEREPPRQDSREISEAFINVLEKYGHTSYEAASILIELSETEKKIIKTL